MFVLLIGSKILLERVDKLKKEIATGEVDENKAVGE